MTIAVMTLCGEDMFTGCGLPMARDGQWEKCRECLTHCGYQSGHGVENKHRGEHVRVFLERSSTPLSTVKGHAFLTLECLGWWTVRVRL